MNDNIPRRDWRRSLATSDRFHVVSHIYLAAAGVVFALDGWWVMTAIFLAIFMLATALGTLQSLNAKAEQKYEAYRKGLNERQRGPQSWPA